MLIPFSGFDRYEEAAKLFREATADIPNLRLSLQVIHANDPKLNSAKKLHEYQSRLPVQTELERREQAAKAHQGNLQCILDDLVQQETGIAEHDYAKRLDILQKRAEKMSEISHAKQEVKRIVSERRALTSAQPLDMTVVERELKRILDVRQETAKMIDAYKARIGNEEAIQLAQTAQSLGQDTLSIEADSVVTGRLSSSGKSPRKVIAGEVCNTSFPATPLKAAPSKAQANQEQVNAQEATADLGIKAAPLSAMNSETAPAPVSPATRALWENHPIYGQIPSGYAAFPELHDIPPSGHPTTPLHIPLRRLGDAVRDLVPVSQAISAHAQAAAHAASAQMQQQVKETTGAVATDLKNVLEGFLSNLGGQLAVFEEGFKERIDQSATRINAPVPKANVDVKPKVEEEANDSKDKASFVDACVFPSIVCDECGEHPIAINLKCKDVSYIFARN